MNGVPISEEDISKIVISNPTILEIFKKVQDRVNKEVKKGEFKDVCRKNIG